MDNLANRSEKLSIQAQQFLTDIESQFNKKIYIAGPMSNRPDNNRDAFNSVASLLRHAGFVVLNPAILPDGLSQQEYMQIDLVMLMIADTVVLLEDWQNSPGAVTEYHLAYKLNKTIVNEQDINQRLLKRAA